MLLGGFAQRHSRGRRHAFLAWQEDREQRWNNQQGQHSRQRQATDHHPPITDRSSNDSLTTDPSTILEPTHQPPTTNPLTAPSQNYQPPTTNHLISKVVDIKEYVFGIILSLRTGSSLILVFMLLALKFVIAKLYLLYYDICIKALFTY